MDEIYYKGRSRFDRCWFLQKKQCFSPFKRNVQPSFVLKIFFTINKINDTICVHVHQCLHYVCMYVCTKCTTFWFSLEYNFQLKLRYDNHRQSKKLFATKLTFCLDGLSLRRNLYGVYAWKVLFLCKALINPKQGVKIKQDIFIF